MPNQSVKLLFALFTLSGFTGLIYESVWSHYLKLYLGAAAFAQSFVLAAFMGGLALGAWLASRWSSRLKNLLAAYGWIEAAIGVAALLFHEAYVLLTQASLDHVIPALGSPGAVEIFKYTLCAALIVPQTVLLGMTFPLLSGAVIRREPHASGHHLAMLYFTNSIGAAIGALAAAFWLLGWLGMPGTMRLAGALNLALAAAVLAIARGGEPAPFSAQPQSGTAPTGTYIARLFLAGAFVTGLASFVYEIVWIRMLSLVLGSSFHAFELMLSAFITGLALGGLWIRRRIDHIADPVRYAGLIQVVMGLAALATVFIYHRTFDWMEWALGILQHNDAAYPIFNLFSHALAFAVMLPTTFLAGMTLPLFTLVLLRGGGGERAIGQVYAANTLGATARAEVLQPERLASGVFRYGVAAPKDRRTFFYRDGKTASVAVLGGNRSQVTIATNGKPDAAMYLDPSDPPLSDEYTMTLLAALPLLMKPDARSYANIGWGSGLTAEVLLSHGGPREVDTIEIEPAMVAGARSFFPRNIRAYRDPRSQVYFEDAKSYFARHGRRYDVIVSEPSNPWVNGVAGLFTTEFYRETKRYLAPGGLLVQWLHPYELNDRLLGAMLGTVGENFSDFEVYEANGGDLIVVAVAEGRVPRPGPLPENEKTFMQQLGRIGIKHQEAIAVRSIGTKGAIAPLFAPLAPLINSDFHPLVQLEAPRARFQGTRAEAVFALAEAPLPILEMAGGATLAYLREPAAAFELSPPVLIQSAALMLERGLRDRSADPLRVGDERVRLALLALKQPGALCGAAPPEAAIEQLHWAATVTLAHLAPALRRALWIERKWLGCAPARLSPQLRERLDVYAAITARDARAMLERARALLAGPARGGDDWGRFLLLTAMLGGHVSGEHEEAGRLWLKYRTAFYPNGEIPLNVVYVVNLH